MANSQISVTEGSGKNIASYSFTESTTKEAQRVSLNNSSGTEIGTTSNPIAIQPPASGSLVVSGSVSTVPLTTGGLSTYHLASAASTNAVSVKASAGQLYAWAITNTNASIRYIAFHNTAGTPTAGASVFFKFGIPAGGAANVSFENGIAFSSGIGITTVTGAADSDSTGVASTDLIINLFYK